MKQYWQRTALKIDALTLRERAIIFMMSALILVVLVNTALLDPQYAKQKQLSERIKQEQGKIAAMQAEIQQKMTAQSADPDRENKARLQQLKQQLVQMQSTLQGVQKGLVPPDRMAALLEDILKRNGRLRLVSLTTLPVSGVTEALPQAKAAVEESAVRSASKPAASAAAEKPAGESIYRHGVEIVVQGGYMDMLDYLAQLESMPWQLFWGKAKLETDEYPKATLTLTLYTLSLDKKWLNI
ncbi:MAG TPA: MSHA biogenesis protein MshJ [Noviherbaspirillum sp.]|uniref:MSHA biogenesis protein MshJ n=1 Tax=Noviherbaspirillum sp. TaxID=1926288 RepID=UPI002B4801DB|nr:MSHA biogenesis protein MshJ [Noviherbaspirillum sp.]HJV85657.1 MSHA biogenesis protein MshJ [Noviherbaspirillum sp.]